jgi:tetratricopeptide (TPR) repeat protein
MGNLPISEKGFVRAESAEQQKKKKKKKKKKSSSGKKTKKKSSSKKKKKSKKGSKKKKSSGKKKKSKKKKSKESSPTAQPIESASTINKKSRINSAAYADELFNLTVELQASNRELARATRFYYKEDPQKRMVSLDSKPFFSREDFEKESRLNPDNLYVQRQLGMHYEANGDYAAAKEVYLHEVRKNPGNPDAHFFLGSLYATLGEYQKSKNALEEALYLDPNHGATIEAMSMFVQTDQQKKLSRDILTLSSQRAPDGPAQRITIIREKMASGDYTEALNLSEEASEKFPTHTGFVQLIGENHLRLGRVEEAKKTFQRAVKLNSKDVQPHLSLADLYFEQGKYVYAALSFSDAVYLEPDNPDYRYMQGLSYFNAQEWGRTAAAWEDLLHYRPNDAVVRNLLPQAYYVLAVEYNRIGNPTMGRQAFKNALSVNNNTTSWLSGAMGVLGKFYREKTMYNESLVAYQEVLELSPNNADAYMGMGITYWKMNEKQLARASWEKSIEIKPDNNESRGWLILSSPG